MATLTIRNVPDDVHKSLRLRAAENGRSVEEEIRRILADQVAPRVDHLNRKTPEEVAAAVARLQETFAPVRETYSVDQFIAEKHEDARYERLALNEPEANFRK
jgi:plasmid stability protein